MNPSLLSQMLSLMLQKIEVIKPKLNHHVFIA